MATDGLMDTIIVRDNNKLLSSHNDLSPHVQSVQVQLAALGQTPPLGYPRLWPTTLAILSPMQPNAAPTGVLQPP